MSRFRPILLAVSTLAIAASAQAAKKSPEEIAHLQEAAFKRADSNGDGFISREEFLAKASKKFDEIDTNHDKKISKEEMKAYHDAMRAKREKRHAERQAAHGAKPPAAPVAPAAAPAPVPAPAPAPAAKH